MGIFSTCCFFNRSLVPSAISSWLDKLQLVLFSFKLYAIKPLV
jgi:hypothetical protein